jgi:rubrerythrin
METVTVNPLEVPLNSDGEAVIAEEVCEKTGHEYTNTNHYFARDKHGNAFKGHGDVVAAKFSVYVCRKCGGTVEVKILPKCDLRPVPPTVKK